MTGCPFAPWTADLTARLLSEPEADLLDRHLDGCAACRRDLAEHIALWILDALETAPALDARECAP